jgi:hypothetical protein
MLIKKVRLRYPFSKIRVYFNAIFGAICFALSLFVMISYSDPLTVLIYAALTFIIIILSTRLKIYLLERMERIQSEPEENLEEDQNRRTFNWKLVITIVLVVIAFILPIVTALFINPLWWFICFSSFTVGFSLSEIFLYLSTEH